MIRVRELEAGYGRRQILGPLSFDLGEGVTSTLLGPGGAGKSTLLRLLYGTPGAGVDFWYRGHLDVSRAGARFLTQKPPAPRGTLRERLRDVSGTASPEAAIEEVWATIPGATEAVAAGLDLPWRAQPRGRSRLGLLTVALAGSPPLVFLDEPEADLEEPWHSWVRQLLAAWRGRTTLIVATHHLELARQGSDHALLLVGGRMVESAATETLFEHPVHPRTRDYLRLGS